MRAISEYLFIASITFALAQSVCADSLDQWNVRTSGTPNNLHEVAYHDGKFVAVGQNGIILVSSNVINWAAVSNGISNSLHGVAFGQECFVAVGDGGVILKSPDAVTWTPQPSPTTNHLRAVQYVNDRFFAVGTNGTLLTSSDASSWVSRNSGSSMTLEGVAFGNGVFCAVGGGTTHHSSITYSHDGITWTNQNVAFNYLHDVTFGNGLFVAQAVRGIVWTSTNAIDWTGRQAGDGGYLFDATFAQGVFLAVGGPFSGGSQKIATSSDGLSWKIRPVNTMLSPLLRGVTYGNGSFVAVGEKGIILQSDPVFRLTAGDRVPAGGFQWQLTGEAGRQYRFQSSTNLGTDWTDITNFISAGETTLLNDPTTDNASEKFYRIQSP